MAKAIYAILEDEELESKVKASAEKQELELYVIDDINVFNETISKKVPRIIIIALGSQNIAVEAIINIVRSTNRLKYVYIIGVTPNVDTNSMSKFVASKCNIVVSKAKFTREIDQHIKRNL